MRPLFLKHFSMCCHSNPLMLEGKYYNLNFIDKETIDNLFAPNHTAINS